MPTQTDDSSNHQPVTDSKSKKCGIIMPISEMNGYPAIHWTEVLKLIKETITSGGYYCDLVSNSDEVNIIQKTIVENIYTNDVVICDVSAKNPNVMFELGMRLTFDKATVIICDTATALPFDTSMIEHVKYPADLNYWGMVEFKTKLLDKVNHTCNKSATNKNYSPFLKHFGAYKVPALEEINLSSSEFVLKSIKELTIEVAKLRSNLPNPNTPIANTIRNIAQRERDFSLDLYIYLSTLSESGAELTVEDLAALAMKYYTDSVASDQSIKMSLDDLKFLTSSHIKRLVRQKHRNSVGKVSE